MSLEAKLARRIAQTGPITVAEFMTACLHDPQHGYYATRPAIGEAGDFITAPKVSQIFGELIGLWTADCWLRLGRPSSFRLVEMGPGDGTLMRDMLRAMAQAAPDVLAAADLWLVETSAPLQALQKAALGEYEAQWAPMLQEVPAAAPIILIANELLDCLPARQFVRTPKGWAERKVGLAGEALTFGLSPTSRFLIPPALQDEPIGAVVETSAAQENLGRAIGERIVQGGGAALLIDYGRAAPESGDTLQALIRHAKVDPLRTAGRADLTVHADFPAFAAAARMAGAETSPIITQSAFLKAIGIEQRTESLSRSRPDLADRLRRQRDRLIASDQMGTLFKVVAISSPGLVIAGF